MNHLFRQRAALARLESAGATVGFEHEWDKVKDCYSKRSPPGPPWVRRILGDKFFATANLVIFDGLQLERKDFEPLDALFGLRLLGIVDCKLAPRALAPLEILNPLEQLSLCGTPLDETHVHQLQTLRGKVETLVLTDTGLTLSSINLLRSFLPECRVIAEHLETNAEHGVT